MNLDKYTIYMVEQDIENSMELHRIEVTLSHLIEIHRKNPGTSDVMFKLNELIPEYLHRRKKYLEFDWSIE
jgi:hypothetical protein